MKKKIKKAFTLVELLVVIAILAILATVSIVGYNSFTKKAKVSNDTVLVKQMNDVLIASQQTDDKNNTMTEALEDVFGAGYDVEKLTPTTTNYNIVWDSENDQMVLLDDKKEVVFPTEKVTTKDKMYLITKSQNDFTSTQNEFAHYLTSEFTYSDSTLSITTGLDVGNNTSVSEINYTRVPDEGENESDGKNVAIRTNGGTLTVNAANDSVAHYNKVDKVVITAVAPHSYHEYGNINGDVEITKGHFALEKGATAGTIKVTDTAVANEVKLTNNANEALTIIDSNNKLSTDSSIGESIKITDSNAVAIVGNKSYSTVKEALENTNDGDTVKMIADYRLTKENTPDEVSARTIVNKKITFDFGNYKYIGFTGMGNYKENFAMIIVDADATFVASENGGIIADDIGNNGGYAINIRNGAKLTIKSGTYNGGGTTVQVQKGTFEALGGTYICDPYDNPAYGYKFMINCIDAAYKDGTAKISIKGGTFYKFDPSDSESENPRGSFVSEGYTMIKSADDWYTIVPQK